MIARLLWMVTDLVRNEPALVIDMKRVNEEERAARRSCFHEDVAYRERVMRRMREGLTSQQLAPLVTRRPEPTA